MLPGHRPADRDPAAGGAARCAAVSDGPGADGVSRAGAWGALQRGPSSPRADHQDGQHPGSSAGGGSGVALSAPAWCWPDARAAAERATGAGDCAGGQGAAAVVSPLPAAGRAQAGPSRHRGRGPRTGRISVGRRCMRSRRSRRGAVSGARHDGRRRAGRMRGLGAGTTVAGVASSRASAERLAKTLAGEFPAVPPCLAVPISVPISVPVFVTISVAVPISVSRLCRRRRRRHLSSVAVAITIPVAVTPSPSPSPSPPALRTWVGWGSGGSDQRRDWPNVIGTRGSCDGCGRPGEREGQPACPLLGRGDLGAPMGVLDEVHGGEATADVRVRLPGARGMRSPLLEVEVAGLGGLVGGSQRSRGPERRHRLSHAVDALLGPRHGDGLRPAARRTGSGRRPSRSPPGGCAEGEERAALTWQPRDLVVAQVAGHGTTLGAGGR